VRLVFLGTGGSLPSPKRNVSGLAVQLGPRVLLFDCGEGTQRQFMSSSVSYMKVAAVFITHFHGDHFLGLPGLIQSMNFSGRTEALHVLGPSGTVSTMRSIMDLGYFTCGFDILATEMAAGEELEFHGYSVKAVPAEHTVPAFSYVLEESARPGKFDPEKAKRLGVPEGPSFRRLQEGESIELDGAVITPEMVVGPKRRGRKIAISGDGRPTLALEVAAANADLLVHEATVTSDLIVDAKNYGHATAREAAELAMHAKARALILYHISSRYDDPKPLLEEARAVFPETYVAEDLMSLQVNFPESRTAVTLNAEKRLERVKEASARPTT